MKGLFSRCVQELWGLFVDDGVVAACVLGWIAVACLVIKRLPVGAWSGVILFVGLAAIFVVSTRGHAARSAGFTLLEMLVVLAILGLLGGLVLARFQGRSAGLEMRLASDTVAQTLRLARTRAMASASPTEIEFDTARSMIRLNDGVARRLPAGLSIAVTSSRAGVVTGSPGAILFLPDGSSSGGEVRLAGNGQRTTVAVNWLTGQVSVAAGL